MKLSLCSKTKGIEAYADYDEHAGTFTVLAGSKVSSDVVTTGTFRGAKSVLKVREEHVIGNQVIKNATFKSASTAANFVTGRSTNGLIAWKNKDGETLRKYFEMSGKGCGINARK